MVFGSRKRRQPTVKAQTKKMKTRLQKLTPVLGAAGAAVLGAIALKIGAEPVMDILSYVEAIPMRNAWKKLVDANKKEKKSQKEGIIKGPSEKEIDSVTKGYFLSHIAVMKHSEQNDTLVNTGKTINSTELVKSLLRCGVDSVISCQSHELKLGISIDSNWTAILLTNIFMEEIAKLKCNQNEFGSDSQIATKLQQVTLKFGKTGRKISSVMVSMQADPKCY